MTILFGDNQNDPSIMFDIEINQQNIMDIKTLQQRRSFRSCLR